MISHCDRRSVLALLGGAPFAVPGLANGESLVVEPKSQLLVVLGEPGRHGAVVTAARDFGWKIAAAFDPQIAWRDTIAPALLRGDAVVGVGDAGFGFCVEQLARAFRCTFERGEIILPAGIFKPDLAGKRTPPPIGVADSVAWRLQRPSHGGLYA